MRRTLVSLTLATTLTLALLTLTGCPTPGGRPSGACVIDDDCGGGGSVCTRPSLCSARPGAITIRWTVDGVTPTLAAPAGCTAVGDLRVEVVFSGGFEQLVYAPVPCAPGQTRIDDLPLDLVEQVVLRRVSGGGDVLVAQAADLAARDDGGIGSSELAVNMPLRTR